VSGAFVLVSFATGGALVAGAPLAIGRSDASLNVQPVTRGE